MAYHHKWCPAYTAETEDIEKIMCLCDAFYRERDEKQVQTQENRIKELEEALLGSVIAMTSVYPTLEPPHDRVTKLALDKAREVLRVKSK